MLSSLYSFTFSKFHFYLNHILRLLPKAGKGDDQKSVSEGRQRERVMLANPGME